MYISNKQIATLISGNLKQITSDQNVSTYSKTPVIQSILCKISFHVVLMEQSMINYLVVKL